MRDAKNAINVPCHEIDQVLLTQTKKIAGFDTNPREKTSLKTNKHFAESVGMKPFHKQSILLNEPVSVTFETLQLVPKLQDNKREEEEAS